MSRTVSASVDPDILAAIVPQEDPNAKVALVNVPFGFSLMPCIQLGLLKALLTNHKIRSCVYYLNLPFARELGYTDFHLISNFTQPMLGEWLFAQAAFGNRSDDQ